MKQLSALRRRWLRNAGAAGPRGAARCLLANAWFCTFPRRNSRSRSSEYCEYPSINFSPLYAARAAELATLHKLRCIVHYFERVSPWPRASNPRCELVGNRLVNLTDLSTYLSKAVWYSATTRCQLCVSSGLTGNGPVTQHTGVLVAH